MQTVSKISFVFFGGSSFSNFVLEELEKKGLSPTLIIDNAREDLPIDKLREINANVFVVASFGKILPDEVIYMPKKKTLNVHPSLLPHLRGPAPIQQAILEEEKTGVTIIRLDEKMDHGPIVAEREVELEPWPDDYRVVEEKLGRAGGALLAEVMPGWINGEVEETPQDDAEATYMKMVRKEDGLLDLADKPEKNWRKVLAYSVWPGAYFFFKKKNGQEIRVVVKEAEVKDGQFVPKRVIPEGKREMVWEDFLRGNS